MEEEGQTSGEFHAWATDILHLPHRINTILRGSQQILFYNHCDVFKCLVDAVAQHVQQWLREIKSVEVSQSVSAMAVGKELLRVLKRGLQLLWQFAEEDFLFMIYGSTGEFCEIIDDVKMYCKLMNKLIITSDDILEKLQGEVELGFSMFQDSLSSCYEKDKLALVQSVRDRRLSILPLLEEPQNSIAINDILAMEKTILGKGSSGMVRKVLWCQIPVAIKEYEYEDHFQEEFKILMELEARNCLHIVQVFGHSEVAGGKKALVMELMEMDLRRLLEMKKEDNPVRPFSLWESTDIMLQIAMGIMHLHKQGMIHRDIKPANILVKTREDGSFIVKVADLGCSKPHFQSGKHTCQRGSLGYMAPEMLKKSDDFCTEYTRKVDIFSFGQVCTEILAGSMPLDSLKSLIQSLPEDISGPLNMVTCCCLEKEDRKRPSFGEICDGLWKLKELILTKGAPIQRHIDQRVEPTIREIITERQSQDGAGDDFIAESDLSIEHGFIGQGTNSVVSKGYWCSKPVAVKQFFYNDAFEYEYRIFTKLKATDSSHIIQCLGHTELKSAGGRKAIVLELMDMDLKKLTSNKKETNQASSFSLYESTDIMFQIAKGVRSLHEINVIHRDIKPSNILIAKKDGSFHAKLTGFSVSIADFQTACTHTDMRGTLMYMAPEMAINEGKSKYSRKVDVYSFGILCIEILTGKRPRSEIVRVQQPHSDTLEDLKKEMTALDIPKSLCTIICQCREQDPDRRPTFKVICERLDCLKESYSN